MPEEKAARKAAERREQADRLAEALKANLRRRKAQARARSAGEADSDGPLAPDAPSAKNPLD